ncbi:MAG: hypothetical protein ABH864_00915 [archaeon]
MKKRNKQNKKGLYVKACLTIWAIVAVVYLVFVAYFTFILALESEQGAIDFCNSECLKEYGVGTWQTVENSDGCFNGIYFCQCGDDWNASPDGRNFKIDIYSGKILPNSVAYNLHDARDGKCWD